MHYNINEIFQRMIDYLYDELETIATLEDMYHDIKPHYNYDTDEWYITRESIEAWAENMGIETTKQVIDNFVAGENV